MSTIELLEDSVALAFERAKDEESAWAAVESSGYTDAALLAGPAEAAAVVRTAATFPIAVPIAETALLAAVFLSEAGLDIPHGRLTVVCADSIKLRRQGSDWLLSGTAERVPWGRAADHIVVLADGQIASVPGHAAVACPGENLAGEPRDDVSFDAVSLPTTSVAATRHGPDDLLRRGALARAIAMVGALERVLELTVQYATEREQFGRAIGRFQALQHEIAEQAAHVAAARAIVDLAVAEPSPFLIGCAKIRAGEAAGVVARIAHQIHGAIGYTNEHVLHRFTTRLWSWRDEFGSEEEWAERVGEASAEAGDLWAFLTSALRVGQTDG
jgi:acyl-CoA dehydrogenase